MKTTMRNLTGALLGLSLAACGALDESGQGEAEQREQALEAGCTQLNTSITSHTCAHANSPSDQLAVTASATRTFAGTTPNINTTHKYYTVTLPAGAEGTVKFVPPSTGSWAFFLDEAVAFTVLDASGNTVASDLSHSVSQAGCALTTVSVHGLTSGNTYRLVLGTASGDTVGVSTERVEDYRVWYYQDADGDTWGNYSVSKRTACTPPAGYVTSYPDCNDANASIHPAAAEITGNSVDENCNGSLTN
ncbi:putative metal-binding motif-containing protein [Myxococcaceae bacterium GXIMD 01537]